MRGVVTVFVVVVALVAFVLFAPAAIEGVGENVKDHLPDTETGSMGEGVIDNLYTSIFVYIPLVMLFGFGVWAVTWYLRRQRTIGRV